MIPNHYGRDIPARCQSLLKHLRPLVARGLPDDKRHSGTLDTTFVLAIATPMIVLPIERIYKPATDKGRFNVDDRAIDPVLADSVRSVFGDNVKFSDTNLFQRGSWRRLRRATRFNVTGVWPSHVVRNLQADKALADAEHATARRMLLDVRNALAHGGVAYLDAAGDHVEGTASRFAFISSDTRDGVFLGFNIVSIGIEDFCAFLNGWADWLSTPDVRQALAA